MQAISTYANVTKKERRLEPLNRKVAHYLQYLEQIN